MDLVSHSIFGFLSNPRGKHPRSLTLAEGGISVASGMRTWIGFEEVADKPTLKRGVFFSRLILDLQTGERVALPAVNQAEAKAFAEALETAWAAFNHEELGRQEETIERLLAALRPLRTPEAYPAAFSVATLARDALELNERVLSKLKATAIGKEKIARFAPIVAFASDPAAARAAAIERFVDTQLERWKSFLDTVESKPLTPEQRLAVIVDEDATLVLAGAGSGKTSVITAKAAYLLKAGIRTPDEVLLLAFARDAASEMSERIESRCGEPVAARTFHALSYEIIGAVEGKKPALAPTATDDKAFLSLIKDILRDIVRGDTELAETVIGWFAGYYDDFPNQWDYSRAHEWYSEVESRNLRSLKGDTVKSFEELLIANWLYRNGIAYEYEPTYEHKLPETGRRIYTPDFRLTESGVYIEHFGVRKSRDPNGKELLTTAPFVDRNAYLEGMLWKREVHAAHETVLIETYSWERQESRLLEELARKLEPHVAPSPIPPKEIYDRVTQIGVVDGLTSLIGTFLRHFKNGGYELKTCAEKATTLKMGKRAEAFLKIFGAVYREYQARLGERIDFEDMVLRATAHVESGRYQSPFRHILVDEFQDISTGRARLIQALKAQHADARIFAVGDDWQSIYRFAGSEIHIMRNFGDEFGGTFAGETGIHRTVDLGRTFRSVDKIALAARLFVLRNPAQISKKVVPAGEANQPAIRISLTHRETADEALDRALTSLSTFHSPSDRSASVLLLGRYRFIKPDLGRLQKKHPSLSLSFKTIHASKGLEADHVIILGADNSRMGFPSQIVDDPLLTLVSPEAEPFENAEERRVMYVAMTRARNTVTILASEAQPSIFVRELIDDPRYEIKRPHGASEQQHICSQCGGRLIYMPGKGGSGWYRCEHVKLCGNRMPACPQCGAGLPLRDTKTGEMTCPACGAGQPACPNCSEGWLTKRRGRYGVFLGCVRFPDCRGKAKMRAPR
ncbi:UvrD-helicase domain-containing protein [Thioclava sp. DLFJ4-1]|uniref:UvrD-helicase domain-containing protein n=1 Tax=Thioclava sp. DLFJ4-1 TaxID=1915313 RepID=UPI0009982267|nr:UvrD-helicase domain-containing protein [Thioclava sp. DLFJ4-1]OOY18282.1 helicase IV [Thioclava sp. DLFJ4-1]